MDGMENVRKNSKTLKFEVFNDHLEFWWLRVESKGWDIFDMVYVKCGCSF